MSSINFVNYCRTLCFTTVAAFVFTHAIAQKNNSEYEIRVTKADVPFRIDGEIESQWLGTDLATDFYMVLPMDTSSARVRTDVRMSYDEDNLYLLAVCYHAVPGPYIVESLRRDFIFGKNDNFLLFMDPFEDQTNGFSFGANAAGAQWDGIMYEGGKVDLSWDNKWTSAVRNDEEKWVLEMAIPFKSIRYKKDITRWGINFSRLDLKTTEKSSWAPVPRQFPTASLAYTGTLVWDQPPPQTGANISVIPYGLAGVSKDQENNTATDYRRQVGADAKISLTSSLNLDLTVNPDFSQVEVDRQVTNLDRFELFFPERRQFFLENGDLFAGFGYPGVRPFFSRRIGLQVVNKQPPRIVPIRFGARLSGKVNKDWRVGLMNMQTDGLEETALPAQNFSVLAVQRRVFARSNIGAIVVNNESLNYAPSGADSPVYSRYNRNVGVEYNLASANNLWTGKAFVLKSFTPGRDGSDFAHGANVQYASKEWTIGWQHEIVGKNYNAEGGYLPRQGYEKVSPFAARLFFPNGTKVLSHGPRLFTTYIFMDRAKVHTDNESVLLYQFNFRSQSIFAVWVADTYVKLLAPFDPTNMTETDTLARGTTHRWWAYGFDYFSKPQQLFTFNISTRYGGYYAGGTRLGITSEFGYRFQPYVSLLLSSTLNQMSLPEPWNKKTFWLVGPRLDVTMTNKLFFTAFAQYNEQQKNVNLNTRLQWRYKPASDLFIVYTDNYLPETFNVRNRAIVLKLTYWWNI